MTDNQDSHRNGNPQDAKDCMPLDDPEDSMPEKNQDSKPETKLRPNSNDQVESVAVDLPHFKDQVEPSSNADGQGKAGVDLPHFKDQVEPNPTSHHNTVPSRWIAKPVSDNQGLPEFKDQTRSNPTPNSLLELEAEAVVENGEVRRHISGTSATPIFAALLPLQNEGVLTKPSQPGTERQLQPTLPRWVWPVTLIVVVAIAGAVGIVFGLQSGSSGSDNEPTTSSIEVSPPTNSPVTPVSLPHPPTETPMKQPNLSPVPPPTQAPPLPPSATPSKAIMTTQELYDAVDQYLEDPMLTLEYGDTINDWDVSRVTSFARVFDAADNVRNAAAGTFNEALFSWDVSSGTDFSNMFEGAEAFNQDISAWDTGSAIALQEMFDGATAFNQNLSHWNVRLVENMQWIFWQASSFNGDLSGWNTTSVTNMHGAFYQATAFNQDLSSWNVGQVQNMNGVFYNASAFNQDLSQWNVQSVTDARWMFAGANSFNQDLCAWRTQLPETAYVGFMFGQGDPFGVGPALSCPSTLDPDLPSGPMCHVCEDGRDG